MKKNLFFLFIFLGLVSYATAQTVNEFQFGAGSGIGNFFSKYANNQNYFIQFQRGCSNKEDNRFFWGVRSALFVEDFPLRIEQEAEISPFFVRADEEFAYRDLIVVDENDSGIKQLRTFDSRYVNIALTPHIGWLVRRPERVFNIKINGGIGMKYSRDDGFYSATRIDIVDEFIPNDEEVLVYIEGFKQGFEFNVMGNLQLFFRLKQNFRIGVDGVIETQGLKVTHNIFIAKQF